VKAKEFTNIVGVSVRSFAKETNREYTKVIGEVSRGFCTLGRNSGGKKKHKLYQTWNLMVFRCHGKSGQDYKYYGGRGIRVCARWFYSFDNFLEDMGPRPYGYTLDREDPNGNYEPSNCRWASRKTQSRNREYVSLNLETAKALRSWYSKGYKPRYLRKLFPHVALSNIENIIYGRGWRE